MSWAENLKMNMNWLVTGNGPMTMGEQSEDSPEVVMLLRENRELRIELERAQKGKQPAVVREKTATAAGEKRASAG